MGFSAVPATRNPPISRELPGLDLFKNLFSLLYTPVIKTEEKRVDQLVVCFESFFLMTFIYSLVSYGFTLSVLKSAHYLCRTVVSSIKD